MLRFIILATMCAELAAFSALAANPTVTLENNQPFALEMPVRIHWTNSDPLPYYDAAGELAEKVDGELCFIAKMPSSSVSNIELRKTAIRRLSVQRLIADGEGLKMPGYGRLTWQFVARKIPRVNGETNEPADFASEFQPTPLRFTKNGQQIGVEQWIASTTNAGLQLQIEVIAYDRNFFDINVHVTNLAADPDARMYVALVGCWEQSASMAQTICYDNNIFEVGINGMSPNRAGGGSQVFKHHGVDWIRTLFADGGSAAWINSFAPSFTVLDDTTNNYFHAPRYALANLSQLGQEAQTVPGKLFSITEIARSDTRTFHDRPTENRIPVVGDGVSFSSRIVLSHDAMDTNEANHQLLGYTGYNAQTPTVRGQKLSIGVPSIRFGTSYFPYSTLGENFDEDKLPGMDRESFWPLAADTVLHWKWFRDDIRRDLHIAKAMGFQSIRLHHLELLASIPESTRREYLDFLFGEIKDLRMKALVDIYASPPQLTKLCSRYRDVIEGIEIENEILIWGIPLCRPEEWKEEYAAVKKAAPEIPVCLTGYNNTGMFDKLQELGVPFDRVDLHSYIDNVEAIPSGRGYALAIGSTGTRLQKAPLISEWNWRGLTRISEENRAEIYAPIIDNALATRAIPDFYQFQFNETLSPNPRVGRGNLLRHYELIHLSRRPKPEAFEFIKLIEKYSAATDSIRILRSPHEVLDLSENDHGTVNVPLTNCGGTTLKLNAAIDGPKGIRAQLKRGGNFTLKPGETTVLPIDVVVTNHEEGFYHLFVRLESKDGLFRYLWVEIRQHDEALPVTKIGYRKGASVLEIETASALAETMECEQGVPVTIGSLSEINQDEQYIYVGLAKDAPANDDNCVEKITGKNTREVERAGMERALQSWKTAKDSAARRVGIVRKDLPRGGDAAKLP